MMTTQAEELLMNDRVGIFQRAGQLVRIITEAIKPKIKNDIKRPEDALVMGCKLSIKNSQHYQ